MDWIWEFTAEAAGPWCPIIFLQCWTKIYICYLSSWTKIKQNYLFVYYSLFTIDHTRIVNIVIRIQKKFKTISNSLGLFVSHVKV